MSNATTPPPPPPPPPPPSPPPPPNPNHKNEPSSHPCYRDRSSDGPIFTSLRVPSHPSLEHSCDIPFGFIFTPLAILSSHDKPPPPPPSFADTTTTIAKNNIDPLSLLNSENSNNNTTTTPTDDPILCIHCLTYLNMYAPYNPDEGTWQCPLCHATNVAPPGIFLTSQMTPALMSPIVEYRRPMTMPNDNKKSGCVVFVIDENISPSEMTCLRSTLSQIIYDKTIMSDDTLLGLVVFSASVQLYRVGLSRIAAADCFSPNDNDEDDDFLLLGGGGDDAEQTASDRCYLGSVGTHGSSFLDILETIGGATHPRNHHSSRSSSSSSGVSNNGGLSRREQLRLKREQRLLRERTNTTNGTDTTTTNNPTPPSPRSHRSESRCSFRAIQIATQLLTTISHCSSRRIILLTNGLPNTGPGRLTTSQQRRRPPPLPSAAILSQNRILYSSYARHAHASYGILYDTISIGDIHPLGQDVLLSLVKPSGGYALNAPRLSDPSVAFNLTHILKQTRSSRSCTDGSLNGVTVDWRMDSSFRVSRVIGAAATFPSSSSSDVIRFPSEREAFARGCALAASRGFTTTGLPNKKMARESCTRMELGRYDPLATVSVVLKLKEEIVVLEAKEREFVFCQAVVRYVDETNECCEVTRVYSRRMAVSHGTSDYLDGVDEEVVPLLLGREAVLRSLVGRGNYSHHLYSEDDNNIEEDYYDEDDILDDEDEDADEEVLANAAKKDLDATIHRISRCYRLRGLVNNNDDDDDYEAVNHHHHDDIITRSSLDFAFPPELADALHSLHHLRRGALLNPRLVSHDDRTVLRDLYLRLPLRDAIRLMAPTILSFASLPPPDDTIDATPVPPETLVLWSSRTLACDHFDKRFIWMGSTSPPHLEQHAHAYLTSLSHNRFPHPCAIESFKESSSMSRRLTWRLAPTHYDPIEQQLAHFPALAELSEEEMRNLRGKWLVVGGGAKRDGGEGSFREWFWGVVSASSTVGGEGVSLGE